VAALAVDGTGTLYASWFLDFSQFTNAYIMKWDGTTWVTIGENTTPGYRSPIYALAVDGGGVLYAGGDFNQLNGPFGLQAQGIAKWNGSTWSTVGAGIDGGVKSLALDNLGNLYAGGYFRVGGNAGTYTYCVMKLNGSTWSQLGTGMNGSVTTLVVDASGDLYAGGSFTTVDGISAQRLAKWNGSTWNSVGAGLNGSVNALTVDANNHLYVGGSFSMAGAVAAQNIARWDGNAWHTLGTGLNNAVNALTANGALVFAGGSFTTVGDGSKTTNRFGAYEPSPTTPIGTTWTGALSSDWFAAGNWTDGVPTATVDAGLAAGAPRYPLITNGTALAHDLNLATGTSLTFTGGTLNLQGTFTNQGTFTAQGGTVELTGPAGQGVAGSLTRFWNLRVGAGGAALGGPVAVQRLLTLDGDLDTNGQPLTLESTPTQTAMVVNNGGVVVGNATVQRAISPGMNPGAGYRHYSPPVSGSIVSDLATTGYSPVVNPAYNTAAMPGNVAPFPTVFGYEQSRLASATSNLPAFDKGWFSPAATDPLQPGRGYTVHIAASEKVDFVGSLNNGTVPLTLARNVGPSAAEAGWALLGNPYPAPLDWSLVAPADRPNVEAAIYVFESSSPYGGQYRSYVNGVGNSVVPVAQAFFARVAAGQTSGTLTLRNSHRLVAPDATPFYRNTTRPLVQLTLQGATLQDEAYVYFEQGATAGTDTEFDAIKLPNPHGLNLSTQTGNEALAINGLPSPGAAEVVVPLQIRVPATGTYSLVAAQLLHLGNLHPFLRDRQTGVMLDLQAQSRYSFTLSAANTTPRFELVFTPQQLLGAAPASLRAQVAVYPNPAHKAVAVELPAMLGHTAVPVELVDALGRVLQTQMLSGSGMARHFSLQDVAPGIYALRIATSQGTISQKLIVE